MKIPFIDISRYYKMYRDNFHSLSDNVFSSGKLIDGIYTQQCEQRLSGLYGYNNAVMTGSCTDALYFSLKAAGIKPGDEVITTSFSYIASVSPIINAGAIPVLVDLDPKTGLMDMEQISLKITSRTKAIIAVHLYGQVLEMSRLHSIAQNHDITIIEDAAQSIGFIPDYKERKSDYICLSFDPTKVVHAFGTGGAVICNNEETAIAIKNIRCHYKKEMQYYFSSYNSRISEQQASFLLFQLDRINDIINDRLKTADDYKLLLQNIPNVVTPDWGSHCNYHKFVIQTPYRDELQEHLSRRGIQTMIHYAQGLFEQPILKRYISSNETFPNCSMIAKQVLSLPIYWGITKDEVNYISKEIVNFLEKKAND